LIQQCGARLISDPLPIPYYHAFDHDLVNVWCDRAKYGLFHMTVNTLLQPLELSLISKPLEFYIGGGFRFVIWHIGSFGKLLSHIACPYRIIIGNLVDYVGYFCSLSRPHHFLLTTLIL